jgi:hypothetical protein
MTSLDKTKGIFFYQVPEVVLFSTTENYYQYLAITESLLVGTDQLKVLGDGIPDYVITPSVLNESTKKLLTKYHLKDTFSRYQIFSK